MLRVEGGYVDNPADPGGETKFGISKRFHLDLDIKNLTEDQAAEIYRREYWEPNGCDALPWPLDMCVFDTAVNMGAHEAAQLLTKARGQVMEGGNPSWKDFLILRMEAYAGKRQPRFIDGWINRVVALWRAALAD